MAEEKVIEELKNQAPNLAGQTEDRDTRALTTVIDTISHVAGARGHQERVWTVIDRIWRGDPISRYFEGENATNVQEAFKMERAATPRVMLALWPSEDWFRLIPERQGSVDPVGAKKLMQEQFRQGKLGDKARRLVQMCAKYGTAIAKVPWIVDRLNVRVSERKDEATFENGQQSGIKSTRVVKEQTLNRDRSELQPLFISDFYIDWTYATVQEAPWCADKFRQTKEDIKLKVKTKVYQNITNEQIEKIGEQKRKEEGTDLVKDLSRFASGANMLRPQGADEIQSKDWWGLFDLEGDGNRVECNITIIDDQFVVRISKNNLWHGMRPYLSSPWTPVEGEFYGIGIIEPIVPMALDVNDQQNSLNAAAALSVNPMVKVGDGMNIIDDQLFVSPGRVFRGEQIEQLQPFLLPDTSQIARLNKAEIRQDIEETTGIPRLFLGGASQGTETATEFSGRQREANLRLREVILALHREIQIPYLEMCLFNNQQFLDETRVVQYEGRAGQYFRYQATPVELAGIARVKPIMAPQIELLGLRGRLMTNFIGTLAQLGELANQEPFRALLKKSFENEFGREDADLIWPESDLNFADSQEEENLVMQLGKSISVRETDNHELHLTKLNELMTTPEFENKPASIKAIFFAHRANHALFITRDEEAAPEAVPLDQQAEAAMQGEGVSVPVPSEFEGVEAGRALAEEARAIEQG